VSSFPISDTVAAFADSYLSSLDELIVLVLLIDAQSRWWDARSVARETGIQPAVAARILDRFAARNLLDIRVTDDVRYQYQPAVPEVATAGTAFAETYRRNPAGLMRLVARRHGGSLRDFADAFRIRRDERG
jgi:hypothetical protein